MSNDIPEYDDYKFRSRLEKFYSGKNINLVYSTFNHGLIPVYTQNEKYSDDLFS